MIMLRIQKLSDEINTVRVLIKKFKRGRSSGDTYTAAEWKELRGYRKTIQIANKQMFDLGYRFDINTDTHVKIPTGK